MRRPLFGLLAVTLLSLLIPPRISLANESLRHQLNATLPEVKFDGVGLSDAIDFLRDVSGANIVVNWRALEADGVNKDTPLNIRLRSISLRRALNLILEETGGNGKIGFTYEDNVIEITTQEIIDSKMYTRVYPVQDLIMEVPDFTDAPQFDLQSSQNSGSGNGGQSSSGIFGNTSSRNSEKGSKTAAERANDLVELIRSVVQPDVWRENGGKATITYFNGNLIVTAPRSVQEAIGGPFD